MPKNRSWTDEQLVIAVENSKSYRAVLIKLKLVPAGGNYEQIKRAVIKLRIPTAHFTGKGWNEGMKFRPVPPTPIDQLLVANGTMQSYSLKKRLFMAGLKTPLCEMCGWAQQAQDGRIPVELDHINGDRYDNRLENLRILCPNCHSLQPTHRGKNKKHRLLSAGVVTGSQG
ncbi:MAG: HNH endonuclease signature motif containing protein [Candidatus Saccharimonadales bacterium]